MTWFVRLAGVTSVLRWPRFCFATLARRPNGLEMSPGSTPGSSLRDAARSPKRMRSAIDRPASPRLVSHTNQTPGWPGRSRSTL